MLNNEIWKDVDDLPYEISNLGILRRKAGTSTNWKKNTHVKPYVNNKGYMCVHMYKDSKCHRFLLHRLLATYFIPNPNNLKFINHIDGNTLNNSLDNLEWCTHQQNMQHAWDTGLHKNRAPNISNKKANSSSKFYGVSWSKARKKWAVGFNYKGKRYACGRYSDEIDAAKAYDEKIIELGLEKEGYKLNFM